MTAWKRMTCLLFADAVFICGALYISVLLRFDGSVPEQYHLILRQELPYFVALGLLMMAAFKTYNRVWEYASIGEMIAIIKATSVTVMIFVLDLMVFDIPMLPRSVYIITWVLMTCFIGTSRLWWRALRGFLAPARDKGERKVLIVGAGDAGALMARELLNNVGLRLKPVAFVDDDPGKQHLMLYGIPVRGRRNNIPRVVGDYGIDEIIIAMPSITGPEMREIVSICRQTRARVRILPNVYRSAESGSMVSHLRDVQMDDLLRRDPVKVDLSQVCGYLTGKVVLVTGAGGSIGSELCRQIASFSPERLVLVDNCENNLFEIEQELIHRGHAGVLRPYLQDIRRQDQMGRIFEAERPQVVFHAAAFKHVPMMERHPDKAIENNVFGTRVVAEAAHTYGSETFILISTDKAVNPTSVMGATKRLAEMVVQDIGRDSATRFAAVRFGNVLGSRGSVVPTFIRQIEKGGPVTVTHPDMVRYFMTIPEAVLLVLQAGAMAEGGEVFVLDMGEPVRIVDLASDLIRLAGLEPGVDIEIKYTGIRPGEKLYEELWTRSENMMPTSHQRIFKLKSDVKSSDISKVILGVPWAGLSRSEIIQSMRDFVPEFRCGDLRQIG